MILSDREVRAALARGAVRMTPLPSADAWSSSAVDLTLAEQLSVWVVPGPQGNPIRCSPHDPGYQYATLAAQYSRTITIPPAGYTLVPQAFVLGWTVENLCLPRPSRIAARVEGKSSLARLGMGVHVTAPTIHAGFGDTGDPQHVGNPIQLEIWNFGPLHIVLQTGMRICQLIFEAVDGTPEMGYAGQFHIQGPQLP